MNNDVETEKIDRVIQLLQQGARNGFIQEELAETAINILMTEPPAPPATHDAEIADAAVRPEFANVLNKLFDIQQKAHDAAVRRCIEAVRNLPVSDMTIDGLHEARDTLEALLTSEPSNG